MTEADRARKLAMPMEIKKHGLRQQQSGEWVISFTVHPNDMAAAISLAPMGTRYQAALVELSDDGQAKEVMQNTKDDKTRTTDTAPVRVEEPARAQYDRRSEYIASRKDLAKAQMEAEPPKRRLEHPRTPCKFDEMNYTKQSAILAADPVFQHYLTELHNSHKPFDADRAADYIRNRCNVASRREILPTNAAGKAWLDIVKQYRTWQLLPRVGG